MNNVKMILQEGSHPKNCICFTGIVQLTLVYGKKYTYGPTKVIRVVWGTADDIFLSNELQLRNIQIVIQDCAPQMQVKALQFKAPNLGNLFYLQKCGNKNMHIPLFVRNIYPSYYKNGLKAHFYRQGLLYLQSFVLLGMVQSKI